MLLPLIILAILLIPFGIAMLSNAVLKTRINTTLACYISLGISFLAFGSAHFIVTEDMVAIVPPFLPAPEFIVLATGTLELAIGVALFTPKFRRKAALLATLLIIGFFSANIYAAFTHIPVDGYIHGPIWLLARTPVQAFLAIWAYWFCFKEKWEVLDG